jgi:hypothetical protein
MLCSLAVGPRHWIPTAVLLNLDQVGFPLTFPSLRLQNQSAMIRTALSTCSVYRSCSIRLHDAENDLDTAFVPRLQAWYDKSMVKQLRGQLLIAQRFGVLDSNLRVAEPEFRTSARKQAQRGKLQSILVKAMRPHVASVDLQSILRRRLQRWLIDPSSAELNDMVAKTISVIADVRKAPPCVAAAVLKTWLNGWCTARRFQEPRRSCWLCETCSGDDSLEHYAVCPFAWSYLPSKLRISDSTKTIKRFMLLEPCEGDTPLLLACHVYAVMGVVNTLRAQQTRPTCMSTERLLWERWRAIGGRSRLIQKAVRARWQ